MNEEMVQQLMTTAERLAVCGRIVGSCAGAAGCAARSAKHEGGPDCGGGGGTAVVRDVGAG